MKFVQWVLFTLAGSSVTLAVFKVGAIAFLSAAAYKHRMRPDYLSGIYACLDVIAWTLLGLFFLLALAITRM